MEKLGKVRTRGYSRQARLSRTWLWRVVASHFACCGFKSLNGPALEFSGGRSGIIQERRCKAPARASVAGTGRASAYVWRSSISTGCLISEKPASESVKGQKGDSSWASAGWSKVRLACEAKRLGVRGATRCVGQDSEEGSVSMAVSSAAARKESWWE